MVAVLCFKSYVRSIASLGLRLSDHLRFSDARQGEYVRVHGL